VAPLKQGVYHAHHQDTASFHAYKSVAPLKHFSQQLILKRWWGFHAYKSVAPLKLRHRFVNRLAHLRFHAYKSVAPLKQMSHCLSVSRRTFPRLQKRGPIEARRVLTSLGVGCQCFHAYKSVAPLKHHRRRGGQPQTLRFHAYKSVAPLKLSASSKTRLWETWVSTLTKAWPH